MPRPYRKCSLALMFSVVPDCRRAAMLRVTGGSLCPLGGRFLEGGELLTSRQRGQSRRALFTTFLPTPTPLGPWKKKRKQPRWSTLHRFLMTAHQMRCGARKTVWTTLLRSWVRSHQMWDGRRVPRNCLQVDQQGMIFISALATALS